MFWKYIFPVILCLLLAWFIRKFLCIKPFRNSEEQRIPRLWIILLCLLAFVPILDYIIFGGTVIGLLAFADCADIEFRKKPFKSEKLQKWLLDG